MGTWVVICFNALAFCSIGPSSFDEDFSLEDAEGTDGVSPTAPYVKPFVEEPAPVGSGDGPGRRRGGGILDGKRESQLSGLGITVLLKTGSS